MSPLRVGLVGLGMMGRNHARVLRELADTELVGIADPVSEPDPGLGEVTWTSSVDELLALGLDACVVAAPTSVHREVGERLAAAGVPTLIEKPLAGSVADATAIAEAYKATGTLCAVGHIERYNPASRAARDRLDGGLLGDIHQLTTRRQSPFPGRIGDVGVVFDLATHDLDLTAHLTGEPITSVSARTACRAGREHEDLVVVLGELADGTITNHLVNWLTPTKERLTTITGEAGMLVVDTLAAQVTFYENASIPNEWESMALFRGVSEGDVVRFAIERPEPLRVEHEAFVEAVRGGETGQVVTAEQGLQVVRVATAVLESARTGRTVEVAEV